MQDLHRLGQGKAGFDIADNNTLPGSMAGNVPFRGTDGADNSMEPAVWLQHSVPGHRWGRTTVWQQKHP